MDLNATLLFEILFFLSFVLFTMRYIWPLIDSVLEQRKNEIERALEISRSADIERIRAQEECDNIIKLAKEKSEEMINEAFNDVRALLEKSRDEARHEKDLIILRALQEIDREKLKVRDELKSEVVGLCLKIIHSAFADKNIANSVTENVLRHYMGD